MKIIFKIFFAAILFTLLTSAVWSQRSLIEVKSAVDTAVITIGDRIKYSIEIDHIEGMRVEKPGPGANLGQFEIKDYQIFDPRKQNGRVQQKFEYTISVFDTGHFVIPAFPVVYFPTDSLTDYKRIEASPIRITVKSVLNDQNAELKDIKAPLSIPFDTWALIAALLIVVFTGLAGFFAYRFYKSRKEKGYLIIPPKPPRPAHELALEQLQKLKQSSLLQESKIKEYYTELSEIIRGYLENRYFVQALEETSKEILEDMKQQGLAADSIETLAEILQLSDLVKFAKHQPGQEENFNIVDRAIDFVNQTKLIYKPEPAQPETAVEKLENNVIE